MERVLGGVNKVLIENQPGGGQGVVPYLPLDQLRPAAPAAQPQAAPTTSNQPTGSN